MSTTCKNFKLIFIDMSSANINSIDVALQIRKIYNENQLTKYMIIGVRNSTYKEAENN